MEIGTAEPIKKRKRKLKKGLRSRDVRRSSGGSDDSSGSNGGGGSGGGSDKPKENEIELTETPPPNKSKILMWFLLVVVLMTFGGLISAYVVIATNAPLEWKPLASLPTQVWISTAIIIAASITYQIAKSSLKAGRDKSSQTWFLWTTVFGAGFISSQFIVWFALINRGLYMKGNPYVGFFYILTAVHAVHVLGGIAALGYIILRTWKKTLSLDESRKRIDDATAIGWYWHTMGGLWLVLLLLLGVWK